MNNEHHSLLFLANYTKTQFFDAVALELQATGAAISWICVNERLYHDLAAKYGTDNVLLIDLREAGQSSPAIGEYKLNELIYGDRALRHIPEKALRYLTNIQQPIYDFLQTHLPAFAIGETTWAHELLVRRIVTERTELGCQFVSPATVRIPTGRFAFFLGETQETMLELQKDSTDRSLELPPARIARPDYFAIMNRNVKNSRRVSRRLLRLKRFVTKENIVPDDPTLIHSDWTRFKLRVTEELNKETYHLVKRSTLERLDGKKFVLVALHKQPEASIDVLGRYYEDQYQNIANVWRALPSEWLLVVKEHTNAIGDRGLAFYRKLQQLPNVVIIDEHADSHELIRRAELVVTVSGTVAYEAALMGKPAVTFAPVFFNHTPACRHIGIEELQSCRSLADLIPKAELSADDLREYVRKNSFEGIVSDPLSDPRCMEPSNVRKVADAFQEVLNR